MPTYVSLINWTEQGIKAFKETISRAEAWQSSVEKAGGHIHEMVWTLGEYDMVAIVDFPSDEALTAGQLELSALGNVRTKTLRAFNADEMSGIIGRTG